MRKTTTLLCAAADCLALGRHDPACVDDTCRGCMRRRAADGLQLCTFHTDRLTRDLTALPTLYADLGLALAGRTGTAGERVSGSATGTGLVLNEAASDAQHAILTALTGWCRLVADQRGVHMPGEWQLEQLPAGFIGPRRRVWVAVLTVPGMATWLGRHTSWLAARPDAGDIAAQLHELAAGRPRSIAYPSGNRSFAVAECPMTEDDGEPCPGVIWTLIRPQSGLLPSELACNWNEDHRWEARDWLKALGPRLLTAGSTAAGLNPDQPSAAPATPRPTPATPPRRTAAPPAAAERCGCACHTTGSAYAVCSVPGGCGSTGCDGHGRITRRPA